jgi:hypothetical protein
MKLPEKVSLKRVIQYTAIIVVIFGIILYGVANSEYVGSIIEKWFTPSQEAQYIIGQYNSTHYYMQNHTGYGLTQYKGYEYLSTDPSAVDNAAIGNLTSGSGGIIAFKGDQTGVSMSIDMPEGKHCYLKLVGIGKPKLTGGTGVTAVINGLDTTWNSTGPYYLRTVEISNFEIITTGNETYGINLPFVTSFTNNVYAHGILATTAYPYSHMVHLGGPAGPSYPGKIDGLTIITDGSATDTNALELWIWGETFEIQNMIVEEYYSHTYSVRMQGTDIHCNKFNTFTTAGVSMSGGLFYFLGNGGYERFVFDSIEAANHGSGGGYLFKANSDFAGVVRVTNLYYNASRVTLFADSKTAQSCVIASYQTPQFLLPIFGYGNTAQSGTINRTFLVPIWIPQAGRISEISWSVTTGSATSQAVMCIYSNNGTIGPVGGTLLYNSTAQNESTSGVGYTIPNLSIAVQAGYIWVGITTNDATQGFARTGSQAVTNSTSSYQVMDGVYFTSTSFDQGLPTTCPAVTISGTARACIMVLFTPIGN